MAFPSLPNFNLTLEFWGPPRVPDDGPADGDSVGQVYVTPRPAIDVTPGDPDLWTPAIFIRLPVEFGLVSPATVWGVIGYPNEWYKTRWTCRVHQGFPNEYIASLVERCDSAGNPMF